jgi:hypothetical protein
VDAAGSLLQALSSAASLDDVALLRLTRVHGEAQRLMGAAGAVLAGEVARRSDPSMGVQGLAHRTGHRTPEALLKQATGMGGREAVTAVRVGRLVAGLDGVLGAGAPTATWLRPVALAVSGGTLGAAAADAIDRGLGRPTSAVTEDALFRAATDLVAVATSVDVDELARMARSQRDELDLGGVALRHEERRQQRSVRFALLPNGMSRLTWLMDPETAAPVKELFDRATSPKLGGIRFVGAEESRATAILHDDRTAEQLASDVFEQLLKQGADADGSMLLGTGAPVVRVAVTADALGARSGLAHLEGQTEAVPVSIAERARCSGTVIPILFDSTGRALDVGREQRTFTARQRHALALRDGGCLAPGCNRPPSWCEAHHIEFWARDGGNTDTADGVLLCRHHHLLFHNAGWEIARDAANRYWITPPVDRDPLQRPIHLRSRSAVMRDLSRERVSATVGAS